tara:strand:+ start:4300 stop:6315 length:2016 start_codon:yes stop_codon:yes gene_type:complete
MSYRNPKVYKGSSLGEFAAKEFSKRSEEMLKGVADQARAAKANETANFDVYRKVNNHLSDVQSNLEKTAIENNVDVNSYVTANKEMISKYKESLLRYNTATEPYEGMEYDEKVIRNSKSYINNAAMKVAPLEVTLDNYNKIISEKGIGTKPGQINPNFSDPRYAVTSALSQPNSGLEGEIKFEMRYDDESGYKLYQVTQSPEIAKLNKDLYDKTGNQEYLDAGDTYAVSSEDLNQAQTGGDTSPFFQGTYATNPDIVGTGTDKDFGIKDELIKSGFIDPKKGTITDDYYSDPTTIVKSEVIDGKVQKYYVDQSRVDYNKAEQAVGPDARTYANMMMNGGAPTVASFVQSHAQSREENGSTVYYYNELVMDKNGQPKIGANGRPELGKEITLGDDGIFNVDFKDGTDNTYGFSQEDYDKIRDFAVNTTLSKLGAFGPPNEKINTTKRFIEPKTTPRGTKGERDAANTSLMIDKALESNIAMLNSDDADAMDFSELNGLRSGYTVEILDPSKPNLITVFGPETSKSEGPVKIDNIDLSKPRKAKQQLYNIFGVKKAVEGAERKMPTPQAIKDLTAPIRSMPDEISEGEFMRTLGDDYISKLKEVGVTIDEDTPGSDKILITGPNKYEKVINLEEADWKSMYNSAIKEVVAKTVLAKSSTKQTAADLMAKYLSK